MSRYDLTDPEWRVIEPLLPNKPRGVPRIDDRVLNGIFWVLRHKGVETPHVQESNQNVDKASGRTFMNKDRKNVRPMNQEDINKSREHLDKLNKQIESDSASEGGSNNGGEAGVE